MKQKYARGVKILGVTESQVLVFWYKSGLKGTLDIGDIEPRQLHHHFFTTTWYFRINHKEAIITSQWTRKECITIELPLHEAPDFTHGGYERFLHRTSRCSGRLRRALWILQYKYNILYTHMPTSCSSRKDVYSVDLNYVTCDGEWLARLKDMSYEN